MRAFVLSTGRCGSVTFAEACRHLTGFTSGHETLSRKSGAQRFAYPDAHIEVDNRLSWFLGELGRRFDPAETLYVHLLRDPEAVARSFLARWDNGYRANIVSAFAHGVIKQPRSWPEDERLEVCRFYVDTVNANIAEFMSSRPLTAVVRLESGPEDFRAVVRRLGAGGDVEAAVAEWSVRHNATQASV